MIFLNFWKKLQSICIDNNNLTNVKLDSQSLWKNLDSILIFERIQAKKIYFCLIISWFIKLNFYFNIRDINISSTRINLILTSITIFDFLSELKFSYTWKLDFLKFIECFHDKNLIIIFNNNILAHTLENSKHFFISFSNENIAFFDNSIITRS